MQEAGADASYVEAPRSLEELKEIAKRQKVTNTCKCQGCKAISRHLCSACATMNDHVL